jgi:hypothetical protein
VCFASLIVRLLDSNPIFRWEKGQPMNYKRGCHKVFQYRNHDDLGGNARSPGHVFYDRLQKLLNEAGSDAEL